MILPIKQSDFSRVRFTSPYGARVHPITGVRGSFHRGIDISSMGRNGVIDLIAPEDGVVLYNRTNSGGPSQGYGHYFAIRHPNNIFTFYAHNFARSNFREGQSIKKGQVFAKIGTTGASTGPHVHFEIHRGRHTFPSQVSVGSSNDTTVDPVKEFFPTLAGYRGKANLSGFTLDSNEYNKVLWVGEVVSSVLTIRNQPTTSGRQLSQLKKGDFVTVYSEEGQNPYKWLEIEKGKFVSNARGDYVKPVTKVLFEGVVNTSGLNVRSVPSTDYNVVSRLGLNHKVQVYATMGSWLYIGKGQFVHKDFVDQIKEEDEMLENAVLIFSFNDFPVAQPVMTQLNAPVYLRGQEAHIKAKKVYVIGGSERPDIPGAELVMLGGKNRFETAASVANHFGW